MRKIPDEIYGNSMGPKRSGSPEDREANGPMFVQRTDGVPASFCANCGHPHSGGEFGQANRQSDVEMLRNHLRSNIDQGGSGGTNQQSRIENFRAPPRGHK